MSDKKQPGVDYHYRITQYVVNGWAIDEYHEPGAKATDKTPQWILGAYAGSLMQTITRLVAMVATNYPNSLELVEAQLLKQTAGQVFASVQEHLEAYIASGMPEPDEECPLQPGIQFAPYGGSTWEMSRKFNIKAGGHRWQAVKWVTLSGITSHIIAHELGQHPAPAQLMIEKLLFIQDRVKTIPYYVSAYMQRGE